MTQSIIVYRNPLEQQFWEGGYLFPIMAGCIVGLVVFLVMYHLTRYAVENKWAWSFTKRFNWNQRNAIATYIAGFFGVWAGLSTILGMI